jgi:hypothetical protein
MTTLGIVHMICPVKTLGEDYPSPIKYATEDIYMKEEKNIVDPNYNINKKTYINFVINRVEGDALCNYYIRSNDDLDLSNFITRYYLEINGNLLDMKPNEYQQVAKMLGNVNNTGNFYNLHLPELIITKIPNVWNIINIGVEFTNIEPDKTFILYARQKYCNSSEYDRCKTEGKRIVLHKSINSCKYNSIKDATISHRIKQSYTNEVFIHSSKPIKSLQIYYSGITNVCTTPEYYQYVEPVNNGLNPVENCYYIPIRSDCNRAEIYINIKVESDTKVVFMERIDNQILYTNGLIGLIKYIK